MACFFPSLNTILLLASCVKIVRTYRVGGRKLEAPGYMRAGIAALLARKFLIQGQAWLCPDETDGWEPVRTRDTRNQNRRRYME